MLIICLELACINLHGGLQKTHFMISDPFHCYCDGKLEYLSSPPFLVTALKFQFFPLLVPMAVDIRT